MPVTTTVRCHFTPVRMIINKKTANNKCWQGCEGKGTLMCYIGGNINWNSHYRKYYRGSSKNYK